MSTELATPNNLKQNVLLILDNGEKQQTTSQTAIEKAKSLNLDLIKISDQEEFSVCKICDLNKEEYKKQQLSKQSKSQICKTKEFKFNYNIAYHDIEIKTKHISELLAKGNKIKIIYSEKSRRDINDTKRKEMKDKMENILSFITHSYSKDHEIKVEGFNCLLNISPKGLK